MARIVKPGEGGWQHLRSMSPDQADEFLLRFRDASEPAIELMISRLVQLGGLDRAAMDYSRESLVAWWDAAGRLLCEETDKGRFADDLAPMWWDPDDPKTELFRRHNHWIRDGFIHYLTQCLLRSSDLLWLEWEQEKELDVLNQPCIVGFSSPRSRFHCIDTGLFFIRGAIAELSGSEDLQRYGGDVGARLFELFDFWFEQIPAAGSAAIQPVWIQNRDSIPFVLSDVEVSRPTLEEIEYYRAECGGDWWGAWYVRVPQGIIANLAPLGEYAGILGEALCGIDGVTRAEWIDKVIYMVDAPHLTGEYLQSETLAVINQYRTGPQP